VEHWITDKAKDALRFRNEEISEDRIRKLRRAAEADRYAAACIDLRRRQGRAAVVAAGDHQPCGDIGPVLASKELEAPRSARSLLISLSRTQTL
jgi:hypothetical protein